MHCAYIFLDLLKKLFHLCPGHSGKNLIYHIHKAMYSDTCLSLLPVLMLIQLFMICYGGVNTWINIHHDTGFDAEAREVEIRVFGCVLTSLVLLLHTVIAHACFCDDDAAKRGNAA